MDRSTPDDGIDADILRGRRKGRLGAFVRGALLGLALFAAFALAISLTGLVPRDRRQTPEVVITETRPVASDEQMAQAKPFSAGDPASTARQSATGRPVPADEPFTTGVPFSAGLDAPVAGETRAGAPDAATGAPAAGEAPESQVTLDAADGPPPADETDGIAPEGPVSAPAEDVPEPDIAGATPESAIAPQRDPEPGAPGEAIDSAAGPQPAVPGTDDAAPEAEEAEEAGRGPISPTGPRVEKSMETASRAPQAGDLPDSAASGAGSTADAPAARAAAEASAPPAGAALAENARAFDVPREAALIAVVLVGEDVGALTADRLSLLPMPLTIAIPPELPRAAEIGAAARAAGHEVLADLSLVEGPGPGAPADRVAPLDMAVGATATEGPTDIDVLEPVLAEVRRRGLAWVDAGAGIDTAPARIARQLGVTYTQGDRSIDDQALGQLHREIDSAARQARQRGTLVLFLDAGEPALEALVQWGILQGGDNPVWFAPISAVIERRKGT